MLNDKLKLVVDCKIDGRVHNNVGGMTFKFTRKWYDKIRGVHYVQMLLQNEESGEFEEVTTDIYDMPEWMCPILLDDIKKGGIEVE